MRLEHHALKQVGALSIKETSFYQANMIQQVLTQQSDLHDNLQASIDQQVKVIFKTYVVRKYCTMICCDSCDNVRYSISDKSFIKS